MHPALAALIFAVTLILIFVRPWRLNEAWTAAAGATAMVVTGAISPTAAALAITGEWNLFLFFGFSQRCTSALLCVQ